MFVVRESREGTAEEEEEEGVEEDRSASKCSLEF